MTLTELARELLAPADENAGPRSDLSKTLVAGALLLAPLSASAALFGPAPALAQSDTTALLNDAVDGTTAQVLDGGSHLKIFGTASTMTSSGGSATYTHLYRWQGSWAEAPVAGQGIKLHAEGSVAFLPVDAGDALTLSSSWALLLDLDADGTEEYSIGGESLSPTPSSLDILVDTLVLASTSGASGYRLDLRFTQTFDSMPSDGGYGASLTIPQNSIDLVIPGQTVPEPSTLALIFGAAGLYRLGSRRKK